MRLFVLLFLALCASVSAQDGFKWVDDKPPAADFSWVITEHVAASDPSTAVHMIEVCHGDDQSDIGSIVNIGDDKWLTCWHVFTDDYGRPWQVTDVRIDDKPVSAKWERCGGQEATLVKVASIGNASRFNSSALIDDQSLTVIGRKTGAHRGTLSKVKYLSGVRSVLCPEPNTKNGDSGAGVFNEAGELVGVQRGSLRGEVFFTPASEIAAYVEGKSESEPNQPLLSFKIISPATWDCKHCPGMINQDWASEGLLVSTENRDGLQSYPCAEWMGANGKIQRLWGVRTPKHVRWSMEKTGVASASTTDDAAASQTPYSEISSIFEAELKPGLTVVDLGCGDARVPIIAVEQFNANKGVGIEIDPARADAARVRVRTAGLVGKVEVITGDSTKMDVSGDVAFVYLYPQTLDALKPKLQNYDKVISYLHPIPGMNGTKRGNFYVYDKAKKSQLAQSPRYEWKQIWVPPWNTGQPCGDRSCVMCYGGYQWRQVPSG